MGLTIDQKRAKIAEACGVHTKHCRGWTMTHAAYRRGERGEWKHFRSEEAADEWNTSFPSDDWKKEIYTVASLLPDYFNDLNAMNEAEKVLTTDQAHEYYNILELKLGWEYASAKANERAEIFGQILKLW